MTYLVVVADRGEVPPGWIAAEELHDAGAEEQAVEHPTSGGEAHARGSFVERVGDRDGRRGGGL